MKQPLITEVMVTVQDESEVVVVTVQDEIEVVVVTVQDESEIVVTVHGNKVAILLRD